MLGRVLVELFISEYFRTVMLGLHAGFDVLRNAEVYAGFDVLNIWM